MWLDDGTGQIESPMPMPLDLVVKNGSKSWLAFWGDADTGNPY